MQRIKASFWNWSEITASWRPLTLAWPIGPLASQLPRPDRCPKASKTNSVPFPLLFCYLKINYISRHTLYIQIWWIWELCGNFLNGAQWGSIGLNWGSIGLNWGSIGLNWGSMGLNWGSMGLNWGSMGLNGAQWSSMGLNGAQWGSMGLDGAQRGSMRLDGARRGSMGLGKHILLFVRWRVAKITLVIHK